MRETPQQRYKRLHPDRCAAAQVKYRLTPQFRRKWGDQSRRRAYGITPEEYDVLAFEAGGYCQLCGRQSVAPSQGRSGSGDLELVLDHNHSTGERRGLICQACNKVLGFLETHGFGREWFEKAEVYLKQ